MPYPLPHRTNIRRVHIDDSKSPGTLWVGNTDSASIVKVGPLDQRKIRFLNCARDV
jgi:hypothetical protein